MNHKLRAIWFSILPLTLILAACGGGGDDGPSPAFFSVSGSIRAADSAIIDSDVNDPLASYTANDDFDQAQPIPNPANLGGYVNVAGSGEPGRSRLSGDTDDYFRVALENAQVINLFIAEASADLDLYLYDETEALVDSSVGGGSTESLTVGSGDGTYFIRVVAASGFSNYNLTVGRTLTAAGPGTLRLGDEFVAGEVIVRFAEDHAALRGIATADGLAASVGLQRRAGGAGRGMLLELGTPADRQQAFRSLGLDPDAAAGRGARLDSVTRRKLDTLLIVKALRSRPEVLSADPNYIRRPFRTPNDPSYGRQWHYPLINLPQAWDVTVGSDTVIVAVIDTGVLLGHDDLAGRFTGGYDFIRSTAISVDGDGIDANPNDPGDQAPGGSSFHGTHVAGTVAAATNNALGVAGVTWNTKIMPLRALGRGGGTSYDVMQCVRYAAGLDNDSGTLPPQKADIMNLSLGGGGYSQSEQDVFTLARNAGVIVVAAAGNASSSAPSYPAAYAGVVSVSAVDFTKNRAWYSNFGATIDVAAPGGNTRADANQDGFPDGVLSTCGDDSSGSIIETYSYYQGTSMAAPHVAGVAALMKAQDPNIIPGDFDAWLINGDLTEDLGPAGRDDSYGHGLIDALKAVGAASGSVPAILTANPASVSFGPNAATRTLELKNSGTSDDIILTGVSDNADWLTVTPDVPPNIPLAPGSSQVLTLTADRGHADLTNDGIYGARIVIASDAANDPLNVTVSLQVGTAFVGGNAGFHYVLLVDPDTLFTRDQVEVDYNPGSGSYRYTFSAVPPGTYQILAGTDSDNDFFIGDAGESFGAYLTVDQPLTVTVIGNRSGLDFTTGFDFNFGSGLQTSEEQGTGALYMRMDRSDARRMR